MKAKGNMQAAEVKSDCADGGAVHGADPAQLGGRVKSLTTACVRKLNQEADNEQKTWLERGRLIVEFIAKVNPDGTKKLDVYTLLADHEESVHQAGQLRNYHAAYTLHQKLNTKGKAPRLSMTHFVAVLPKKLTLTRKEALLNEAEESHLSVSALKTKVNEELFKAKPAQKPTKEVGVELRLKVQAKGLYDLLIRFHRDAEAGNATTEGRAIVIKALSRIIRFATQHRYLEQDQLASRKTRQPSEMASAA